MLRILVEDMVDLASGKDYTVDETLLFAKDLSDFLKNNLGERLHDIDAGVNWFVGFINLPYVQIEYISNAYTFWINERGDICTVSSINDMEKEGHICYSEWNDCVCEGCKFAYDNGQPCRIGCTPPIFTGTESSEDD